MWLCQVALLVVQIDDHLEKRGCNNMPGGPGEEALGGGGQGGGCQKRAWEETRGQGFFLLIFFMIFFVVNKVVENEGLKKTVENLERKVKIWYDKAQYTSTATELQLQMIN